MKQIGVILLALLFVIGCSDENGNENEASNNGNNANDVEDVNEEEEGNAEDEAENQSNEGELVEGERVDSDEEREIPDVPHNFEDAVDYPLTGEFAGESYDENKEEIEKRLDEIPKVTDPHSDEASEAIKYTYSLFAEGFRMPNVPVNQWEAMTVGDPEGEDEKENTELKEDYHVAILLDSSGSMANYENDKTRMELAKESIKAFVSDLPEDAQVTLQAYGHEGTGSEEDKAMSCEAVETVYSQDTYEEDMFKDALNTFEPAGWTPLAKAIDEVKDEFADNDGDNSTNIIYVVSDGEETCGGDPVQSVKDLADSNIEPVINLIGYQANPGGIDQLKEMAKEADGNFINATNQSELNEEFNQTKDLSEIWSNWHKETQGDIDELHTTLSEQIHDWKDTMDENHNRQKENLSSALEYLQDEREFDFGPDPELDFRQNRLSISNGIRSLYLELDNKNRLNFLQKSNEARLDYLQHDN